MDQPCDVQPVQVFLCGCHSVGKTTLLHDIGRVGSIDLQEEVARVVVDEMGWKTEDFNPNLQPVRFEFFLHAIMERQNLIEIKLQERGTDFVMDRGPDPLAYASFYLGPEALERLLKASYTQQCIERYKKSLVFILKPHPECIADDGVRFVSELQELEKFNQVLEDILTELQVPYQVISVLDRQERVQVVLKEIQKLKPSLLKTQSL